MNLSSIYFKNKMQFDFQFGKCFICNDDCDMNQACGPCMRKLSCGEVVASVIPTDTQEPICSYCENITHMIEGRYDFGIRYCLNHKTQAQNDMRKYLIKKQLVFPDDIKESFPDVYSFLNSGIPLRRTNGNLDVNWKLDKQKMISKNDEFGWVMCFYKLDRNSNKIVKNIPVSILMDDIAYSSYFKLLIKTLLKRLENGFYNLY